MKRCVLILLFMSIVMSAFADNDYYLRQAQSYQNDAEYYLKQAVGYDKDAQYYEKEASRYLREAEYYTYRQN